MIVLHRLNGATITLNAELIEILEGRGNETVVCLATGNKYVVTESPEAITELAVAYRKKVNGEAKAINPARGFVRENR